MINSFAFLIPIHPPYYHYIYNLVNQHEFNNIDIFLVFSNYNDFEAFEYKNKIIPIILPENINTNNIVTFKKFYGLNSIINQSYDCFIVCDAEIKLINENFNINNIFEKLNNFFENRLLYAGETDNNDVSKIIKTCGDVFLCENDKCIINKITNNYSLYLWWSDMPIYKRSHLKDFFEKINFNSANINWNHFDHLIYVYYLLLYQNFSIINLTNIINIKWSLECYYTDDINNLYILKNNKYTFSWVTPKLFNRFKDFFIENKTFLLYHIDR